MSECECGVLFRPDPMTGYCELCSLPPVGGVAIDCGECGWKGKGTEGQQCPTCGGGPLYICI